jgi:hypothetical protein
MKQLKILGLGLLSLTSSVSFLAASSDWLDELAKDVSTRQEWNYTAANKIISTYLNEANERVRKLESEINNQEEGVMGKLHVGGYKIQLSNAQSDKEYYARLAKVIKELPENKNQRTRLLKELRELDKLSYDLQTLQKKYDKSEDCGDTVKFSAQITAKKAELAAKRASIKSFLNTDC